MTVATPLVSRAADKLAGRIVFLGTNDQLYTCGGDCGKPQCITCPIKGLQVNARSRVHPVSLAQDEQGPPPAPAISYGWPTFSPDGSKIAFSWAGKGSDGNRYGISVYDFQKRDTIPVFASRNERIVYILWTRDGKSVSFLLSEPQGLSLILAQVKEKAPVRLVLSGAPLYYDWNTNGDRLAVHTNSGQGVRSERVDLMNVTATSQEVERTLSHGRTAFKTPAWSPDGKHLAYVANNNAEAYLMLSDAEGKNPKSMVSLAIGETSFVWSSDSRHIAYSTAVIGPDVVFHGIKELDIESGESKRLSADEVQAFFYSPDGRYLAYIAVPQGYPFYTWNLIDRKDGKSKQLGNFLATQEESISYHYFDQLALSHTIWAPDSSAFVYAGVRVIGAPRESLGRAPEPQLWMVPVDGSAPHSGAAATLAFFSPVRAD